MGAARKTWQWWAARRRYPHLSPCVVLVLFSPSHRSRRRPWRLLVHLSFFVVFSKQHKRWSACGLRLRINARLRGSVRHGSHCVARSRAGQPTPPAPVQCGHAKAKPDLAAVQPAGLASPRPFNLSRSRSKQRPHNRFG